MRKKWYTWALVGALVFSLGCLPGCFICKAKPAVQVASMRVEQAVNTFNILYPQIQKALDEAIHLKLPDLEAPIMWIELARMQVMMIMNTICPDEEKAIEAEATAADAGKVLDDLNKAIEEVK